MPALHVVDQPSRDGAPMVVFVHGSMDRSSSFARVMRLLDGIHAISYDRRGYARSRIDLEVAESVDDHVDDLLEILDGRRAVVVGHSYGGVIALVAAIRRPDLIAAVGAFEAPRPWLDWWPTATMGGDASAAPTPAAAAEAFLRRALGSEAWDMLPTRAKDDRRLEGPALVAEMRSIRTAPPAFDPASVSVPVIVGFGSRTEAHHRRGSTELADALPDAELIEIEGASHGAHSSHPEEFAALVRRAIERSGLANP